MTRGAVLFLAAAFGLFGAVRNASSQTPAPAPAVPTSLNQEMSGDANLLDHLVIMQQESDALSLAIKILKGAPVNGNSAKDFYSYSRSRALFALKAFNAIDEYERKVKAYYKHDQKNLSYEYLMAELRFNIGPRQDAIPYLEAIHAAVPDDVDIGLELADEYSWNGNDGALLPLLKALLAKNFGRTASSFDGDLIGIFARAGQFSDLVKIYYATPQEKRGNTLGMEIEFRKYLDQGNQSDALAYLKQVAAADDRNALWEDRGRLIELLAKQGDKDGVGEACADLFFVRNPKSSTSFPGQVDQQLNCLWQWWPNYPFVSGLDVIRAAQEAGQLDKLEARAKAEFAAHSDVPFLQGMPVLIAAFAHDPALLTQYAGDNPSWPTFKQDGAYDERFAILDELLRWPESKSLWSPLLRAAVQQQEQEQPQQSFLATQRGIRLALQIGDRAYAQELNKAILNTWKAALAKPPPNPPVPLNPPRGDSGYNPTPTCEDAAQECQQLIDCEMKPEMEALLPAVADPNHTGFLVGSESRAALVAAIGEHALEKGWTSSAQKALAIAQFVLSDDLKYSPDRWNGYGGSLKLKGVHLTCDLALRLGDMDTYDKIHSLLSQPVPFPKPPMDMAPLLQDAERLHRMFSDHPEGLTPVAWLDAKTKDGLARTVHWDSGAALPTNGEGGDGTSFATYACEYPRLDGKLQLQLLAGPDESTLDVLKTIPAAPTRGSAELTFRPTDRYLRVMGQTADNPPKVFIGPILPISLGANLMSDGFTATRIYNVFPPDQRPEPLTTTKSVDLRTEEGGPVPDGSYQTATCPSMRLELVGTRQDIVPGRTYLQSGWFKGPSQFAVNYLDADGKVISSMSVQIPDSGDQWGFGQQIFATDDSAKPGASVAPQGAVAFEPVLTIEHDTGNPQWQGLYLGIRDGPLTAPVAAAPSGKTVIMEGLVGATSIVEAPQGNILAIAFADGTVRCFDASTHVEVGVPIKMNAAPAGIAFVNRGDTLVAAGINGDVFTKPTTGSQPAALVYHAPQPIQHLSGSAETLRIALGSTEPPWAAVIDVSSGKEVAKFNLEARAGERELANVLISADGNTVLTECETGASRLWKVDTDREIPLSHHHLDEIGVARFLNAGRALQMKHETFSLWVQSQAGWYVAAGGPTLVYGLESRDPGSPNSSELHVLKTGPILAYCVSSQGDNAYVVDATGQLSRWALTGVEGLPDYRVPADADVSALVQPLPAPTGTLNLHAPQQLRGFPGTALKTPLQVALLDAEGSPVVGAKITVSSDLPGTLFSNHNSDRASRPTALLTAQTDAMGEAILQVHVGPSPGSGTITLHAVAPGGGTQELRLPLEVIDSSVPPEQPSGFTTNFGTTDAYLDWNDESQGKATAFIVEKKVENGPWQIIALLPELSTSYHDTGLYDLKYLYRVSATNDPKYGYPPSLPPPQDRLGHFMPLQPNEKATVR
jgi:hypothetical protein